MKDKISSVKNGFNQFKEIWKNPRYRSIIILGLYFIFFVFIIMALRNTTTNNSQNKKTTSGFEYSFEKIKENNYHYIYEVNLNTLKVIYEGDRYQQKELFTRNDTHTIDEFYNYHDKYLENINNVWSKTENPYLFNDFKDINTLEAILNNALYDSKTEYNDNSKIYTYKISTTNIVKIIEKTNIDIADDPNTIVITTNSNNEVIKIQIDLTSYIYYKNNTNQQLSISLEYSNFGEVEEIKDPE